MKPISDLSELSQEALTQFKKALAASNQQQGDPRITISKAAGITQSSGLVWYDLQKPAKNLFPVLTPLRNKIPRVPGNGGTATNWIAVTGINTAALRGFVPEGRRNGAVTTTASSVSATYASLGLEDSVTFEAELAADNFENIRSTTGMRLLWATQIEEELADLFGNASLTLTKPVLAGTPGTGGSIADGDNFCQVIALTGHGNLASTLANGVPDTVSVTAADGLGAYSYNVGHSAPSTEVKITTANGSSIGSLSMHCAPVPGAVAYAWYVGATGHAKLEAITYINSVKLTALAGTGQDISTLDGLDHSKNAYAYDGIISQAMASNSGAYVKHMATGTDGTGTGLTGDGAGGIAELNALFEDRWNKYKLPVDEIWVNAQEAVNITAKVMGNTGATYPIVHQVVNSEGMADLVGGGRVKSILNPVAMNGKVDVPINIHPNLPPGMILGITWQLPYPVNEVPNVIEMKTRRDYYQMEWPLRTRKYESGVYFDGVLACYFPAALSIIDNIANA